MPHFLEGIMASKSEAPPGVPSERSCGLSGTSQGDQLLLYVGRVLLPIERDGRLQKHLHLVQPERMKQLRAIRSRVGNESPRVLLESLNIFPVLRDARDSNLPAGSIDLVFSNFVLEHISRDVLIS